MDGRHELKHYIGVAEHMQLRARLRVIAKPDENALDGGVYKVQSLYFDNYNDKAVIEKLSGQSQREKFRLRYYNGDTSFIRLEKKSKQNRLSYKESAVITAEQCEMLLAGDYGFLNSSNEALMNEFYAKIRSQSLRPKNIVVYDREAYVYKAGNVRVTFDNRIKTSNNVKGFLKPYLVFVPAVNATVLEIKFDGFMPDIIKDILQCCCGNQTEFSKYVASRLV